MLGVKSMNEIMWLLTSSDDLFPLWSKIKEPWLSGDLSGKDGEFIGQRRDDNSLTINMVKGLKGITEPEVVMELLKKVLEHKCVLAQSKSYRKLPLVSTLTRSYKVQRELQKVIFKYCQEKFKNEVGDDTSWEDLVTAVLSLDSEEELKRIQHALTFQYSSSLISKSKFVPNPPTSLTARVDTLVSQHLRLQR
jgi:hypothetical protein